MAKKNKSKKNNQRKTQSQKNVQNNQKIKIGCWNINGIKINTKASKRKAKSTRKIVQKYDIVILQETHTTAANEKEILEFRNEKSSDKFVAIWSHYTSNSRGVAILIRKRLYEKYSNTHLVDEEGRWCKITFTDFLPFSRPLSIFGLYCPSEGDRQRAAFLEECIRKWEDVKGEMIFGGDWNFTVDPVQDRLAPKPKGYGKYAMQTHELFTRTFETQDAWRVRYPKRKRYTFIKKDDSRIQTRIDRFETSMNLSGRISRVGIESTHISEHDLIYLTVEGWKSARGRGFWRVPTRLLSDQNFREMAGEAVEYFAEMEGPAKMRLEGLK